MSEVKRSTAFLQKRKLLTVAPILGMPFLFFMFYSMGGGKGDVGKGAVKKEGFNTELPSARVDGKRKEANKADYYQKADEDSSRWKTYLKQDPYQVRARDTMHTIPEKGGGLEPEDPHAAEIVQRLDQLKAVINQAPPKEVVHLAKVPRQLVPRVALRVPERQVEGEEPDPQLEKLNGMLDKIIKIQHPAAVESEEKEEIKDGGLAKHAGPDTAAANSVPAVVQADQTLVTGATIALRLEAAVMIGGVTIPKDQLVYGVASINNDRLLININSIRRERSIYSTALQVYDMDGLPGIHIPGSLARETAKQSAEQGINSMNLTTIDPSISGQATNAGIQTARVLLSRKVRAVRVSVRAGYQVLLRSGRSDGVIKVIGAAPVADTLEVAKDCMDCLPFMHKTSRADKMELQLRGIFLQNGLLYFSMRLENHGPIDYVPDYIRWYVRDRKRERRTAVQELELRPLYASPAVIVAGESSGEFVAGFVPFALPRDKELVLQVAERNGARVLVMGIDHRALLHAKKVEP